MERLFFREKIKRDYAPLEEGVMMDRQKYVVGVTGVGEGAGATFTAMGMAFLMGERTSGVTYAEGKPHRPGDVSPCGLLSVDRVFRDVKKRGRLNLYKKVNWQLCEPGKETEQTDKEGNGKNYRELPGKIIIVDNPVSFEDYEKLDLIVAVTDPFPPRIMAGLETYSRLREISQKGSPGHIPVLWFLNKSDGGTARREAESCLKIKFDYEQALLDSEIFYRSAYSCQQPYFMCEMPGLERLAVKILQSI